MNYNDLAEIRGTSIPMFNQHGTALSQEEREAIAKKKGVCVKCGLRTHEVKMFKRTPLTTDHVYDGKCIRCNPNSVPMPILSAWEQKFEPSRVPGSSSGTSKFRMAGRMAAFALADRSDPNGKAPHQNRMTVPASSNSNSNSNSSAQRAPSPPRGSGASQSRAMQQKSSSTLSSAGYSRSQQGQSRPQMTRGTHSYSPSNSASDFGNSSQNSMQSPVVTVGSDVMMNEDYTGSKSKEDPWQIMGMLRDNKGQPDVLRPRLHRLRNVGDDQVGVLHEIKDLLEIYVNDGRMMSICCGALWGVTARSNSLKIEACESGAVGTLLDALNNQTSQQDPDFVQWAIGTMSCLSHETRSRRSIADAGGIETIVASMKRHPTSAGIFEWSCRALFSFVFENDGDQTERDVWALTKNIESISENEGISVLVTSMMGHASETVAQFWAIKLLWKLQDCGDNLSLSKRVTETIFNVGGINACSKILRTRCTSSLVYEQTAALLYRLLVFKGNDGIDKASDCMVTTIRRMSESPDEVELLESCCNLLNMLAPANRLQFKESDGLKAILIALTADVENVKLQRAATNVLWSVSYIPAFFDFSYLEATLGAVAIAKESHPNDAQLLTAACGFIANVATYSAVTASAIQHSIPIHALGLRDSDIHLQDQASRALGNICIHYPHLMKQIVDSGGINSLLDCLSSSSQRSIQSICGGLTAMANASDDYKKQIIAAGCMDVAKRLVQRSGSYLVTEKALELLSALASSTVRPAISMPRDIFQVIMQAMRTQMTGAHELELACGVIADLLAITSPGSTTVDFSTLAEYSTDIINTRSLSIDLKCNACNVIWALCARQTKQSADDLTTMFKSVIGVLKQYKGDEEKYHSQLQVAGAGALVAITRCIFEQNIHISVDDVDTIIAVIYMVMEFDSDNIDLLEQLLQILLNLSYVAEGLVIQCGGIVVVIDTMVEHETAEPVQEVGCAILALLSSTENLQVNICIAETDGIDMIVSALAVFSGNEQVHVDACRALAHLSIDHESRMLISSLGGMILIVNSMNTYLDNLELLEGACSALLNLSSDADEQILADSSIAESVIKAMRRHPDAPGLQEKALGVLQNFSMRNALAKDTIARAGGINAVTSAIKEFLGTSSVVERAFSTLWSLAVLEKNQIEIANAGGIGIVVNAMMANIDHTRVQKQACGCLCTLSSNSENKALIREAGGVDAILFAMWAHYDSEVLQVEACRALSSLAVNVHTNEVMIATEGEINAIISAMRLFPESPKLQEHACVAIRNFMLSEDNANLIRTNATELNQLLNHAASRFPAKCSDRANQILASL